MPGYYCESGLKPFFARNEDGTFQNVPLCSNTLTKAVPNPKVMIDPLPVITGSYADQIPMGGICHSGVGALSLEIMRDGQGVVIAQPNCENDQWNLTLDKGSLPEDESLFTISQKIVYEDREYGFVSTGTMIKDTIAPVISFDPVSVELAREKVLS